jgi:lipoprotein-anchoring transpeptidase ErfK/SrfK
MTAASDDTASARRFRPRLLIALTLVALTLLALAALSASALAYGSTVRDGDRMLPGTTIASVPVGDGSVAEAAAAVTAHVQPLLERTITITHGDLSWETTPLALGATTDVDEVVAAAAARADELGFTDLVRLRWLGSTDGIVVDVTTTIPEENVAAFVRDIAEELDRDPRDAEVAWADDAVAVTVEGRGGREVLQDDAVAAILAAASSDVDELRIPLEATPPAITTEIAEDVAAQVTDAADVALDRAVTVSLGDRAETTTGRDLGATPVVEPLIAAALASTTGDGDSDAPRVELTVPDSAIGAVLDEVTAGSVVAAQDATLDLSGGGFRITPERDGAAVDRAEATALIDAALDGEADQVELELRTLRPAVTADAFAEVLVVDQSSTTVTLYEDGQVRRSWPVAVGTNNSPTPTGTFVVGAKRFEPTWVNPAQDRWGKDMPAKIGPGPDNPLGLRAINWNRPGGGDTLIRFHGTPNEASIGTAASNGCVRMFNKDVIELYDLVSTGAMIISKA